MQNNRELTMAVVMLPNQANTLGNVHGGEIMKLMDNVAGCTALKYAKTHCVTARVDEMQFLEPVHIGSYVSCRGRIAYVGRTSIEVYVTVDVEDLITGSEKVRALDSFFTLVAIDENGRPSPVPPYTPESEAEITLHKHVEERREAARIRHELRKQKA